MSDEVEELPEEEPTKYLSDGAETWSDLEAAHIHDPELAARIRRMSKNYRQAPKTDKQLSFFTPTISDISNKDDYSLMDIATFGLGKSPRFKPIKYDLNGALVTVQGGTDCGMATIFDYDVFLFVVSYLVREMERVKEEVKKGHDVRLPPRQIRPPVAELLKFCRRDDGGKQYKQLEATLERLSSTKISIKKHGTGKGRRVGMFSLIGGFKMLTETRTGNISELSIDIPNWVYDGVVRPDNPTVLTLHNDYFLLHKGYHRFLHRLARKAAGKAQAVYSIETLYERSGSTSPLKNFKSDIKKAIGALNNDPLPDYSVIYEKQGKRENVMFRYTGS